MNQPPNLLARLMGTGRNPDEVLQVIQGVYGQGADQGDGAVILSSGGPPEIAIHFDARGPTDVTALEGFDEARFAAGEARLIEVLDGPQAPQICGQVLFTSRQMTGQYQDASEQFQIIPVPPNAPRPEVLLGDHPFLLEFVVQASPDASVTISRAQKKVLDLTLFLNAILRSRVKRLSFSSHHWVLWPNELTEPAEDNVHWAQQWYAYDGMNARPDAFTTSSSPPIEFVPSREYYSDASPAMGATAHFVLPDTFANSTAAFLNASGEVRTRFLTAAAWLDSADRSEVTHRGSAYVALVAAIEALIETVEPTTCSSCGQPIYSLTRRFREFVGRISADFDPKYATAFYAARSKLVHGAATLEIDQHPMWSFKPSTNTELGRLWGMRLIATLAVVQWLQEQGRSSS